MTFRALHIRLDRLERRLHRPRCNLLNVILGHAGPHDLAPADRALLAKVCPGGVRSLYSRGPRRDALEEQIEKLSRAHNMKELPPLGQG
jgi:hypothetical protein